VKEMDVSKTFAEAVVEINRTAQQFQSSIVIKTKNRTVDAKSILGLSHSILMAKLFKLEIYGPDEIEAKKEMVSVFKKFELPVEVS
jgi:phosphocarrier protein HPr